MATLILSNASIDEDDEVSFIIYHKASMSHMSHHSLSITHHVSSLSIIHSSFTDHINGTPTEVPFRGSFQQAQLLWVVAVEPWWLSCTKEPWCLPRPEKICSRSTNVPHGAVNGTICRQNMAKNDDEGCQSKQPGSILPAVDCNGESILISS